MTDWEGIVADHGPNVWRTAYRLLGNRADADECFQETFAAALALDRPGGPVRQWGGLLTRIATSRAIDRLRQRVRRTSREDAGADANVLPDRHANSRPADRAEQAEMAIRLRSALAHLPPKQADAFCLHCLEGWSYQDVAEQLETSVGDVGVLLHRARSALKERIAFILSLEANSDGRSHIAMKPASSADEVTREQ